MKTTINPEPQELNQPKQGDTICLRTGLLVVTEPPAIYNGYRYTLTNLIWNGNNLDITGGTLKLAEARLTNTLTKAKNVLGLWLSPGIEETKYSELTNNKDE